jgi:RimJ/RimL family protein N-acetyltransferase
MAAPARSSELVTEVGARASGLEATVTRDRAAVRAFLERDRLFSGYALCALDERPFNLSRWGIATRDGEAVAVAMESGGPIPQPVFVAGDPDGVALLLRRVVRPWSAYIAALPDVVPVVERYYDMDPGPAMVRMAVDRASFRPHPGPVQRLTTANVGELNRMYDLGFTAWLPVEAVAEGVYYGLRAAGRLVSAAGTHAVSRESSLAIVGNVMTQRAYQGRGYAKATTGAVTAELLRDVDDVILNVRSDNPAALAAYRALGYREHVRFEERLGHRRTGRLDVVLGPVRRLLGW